MIKTIRTGGVIFGPGTAFPGAKLNFYSVSKPSESRSTGFEPFIAQVCAGAATDFAAALAAESPSKARFHLEMAETWRPSIELDQLAVARFWMVYALVQRILHEKALEFEWQNRFTEQSWDGANHV